MQSFCCSVRSKICCIFLAAILSASLNSSAQQEKIDSLKKILPALKDTARIDCLNQISHEYIEVEKKDSATYYTALAYEEAKQSNYIHGIAVSFSLQSQMAKHFDDDFIRCEELGKESLRWYEKTPNKKGIDNLYFYLQYTVFAQSRFDEAIGYARKRYALAKQNGDQEAMIEALTSMFLLSGMVSCTSQKRGI